jgi:hypothetical protein
MITVLFSLEIAVVILMKRHQNRHHFTQSQSSFSPTGF